MAREERHQRARARQVFIEPTDSAASPKAPPLPDGAHRRLSVGQFVGLVLLTIAALAMTATNPRGAAEIVHDLFFVGFTISSAIKLAAALTPRRAAPPAPRTADAELPVYTVIAPLYREASVAAELVANLSRLDYPRDRLQVLIVLEADDHETQAAFQAMPLPTIFQVLVAPPGSPKTKPRACNFALCRAERDSGSVTRAGARR